MTKKEPGAQEKTVKTKLDICRYNVRQNSTGA